MSSSLLFFWRMLRLPCTPTKKQKTTTGFQCCRRQKTLRRGRLSLIRTRPGCRLAPVSYTHLDVYKRQVAQNCKAPGWQVGVQTNIDRCLQVDMSAESSGDKDLVNVLRPKTCGFQKVGHLSLIHILILIFLKQKFTVKNYKNLDNSLRCGSVHTARRTSR